MPGPYVESGQSAKGWLKVVIKLFTRYECQIHKITLLYTHYTMIMIYQKSLENLKNKLKS